MFDEETSYNRSGPGHVVFGGEISRFLHTFQKRGEDQLEKENFFAIYKKIVRYTSDWLKVIIRILSYIKINMIYNYNKKQIANISK